MKKVIAAILLTAGLTGCRQEEDSADVATAVAVIDGRPLTVDFVREVVRVREKMARLGGSKMDGVVLTNWMNACALQIIPGLISADLLEHEILRTGVKPEDQDYRLALADYNAATRQKAGTIDELAAKFGEDAGAFRRQVERSALFRAYNRTHSPKPAGKEDLKAFYAGITNKIDNARRIDALARENAGKAWKRLQDGEDWSKVAAECSEDALVDEANAEFATDWATVGLDGMEYPELAKALPDLNKGDWSRPLEIDEGMVIVKVVDTIGDRKTLARMLFRMAQPVDVPDSDEAALKMIDRERREDYADETMSRLRENATIEYPLGETFSYTFWE